MRFLRYDPSELRAAGEALVAARPALDRVAALAADPRVWDELVLDWLAARASERARVDAAPALAHLTDALYAELEWAPRRTSSRRGPVALTHLSHPPFDVPPYGYAYWREAVTSERLEVFFAAQIEWGGGGRAAARHGRVMLAAADLAAIEARSKAVLVSTDDEAERRRLVEGLTALRLASWDSRPWLYVDLAWRADPTEHAPTWGLLEG